MYIWLYPSRSHAKYFTQDFESMRSIIQDRADASGSTETWRIRCLPYFYLIGMPRCGSTDLTYSIGFHPYVIQSRLKEFKYWNRARLDHPGEGLK
jgi:N-acetylgalactosamine 4-sulfate 6-O-sulfotransferase